MSGDVVSPADLAQAREAVTGGGALLFRGAGTKLDWGAPPERVDRVVATDRLDRLVAHEAGDLTATVEAGMPLARLEAALEPAGQWLALDPPSAAAGATVGGLLATGDHGPRRQRYGTLRDLVIGTTAVLADGTVSRSGGKVIKNVAGYDLARLLCGSLGTLALVVEVTVRLHPLPPSSATLRVPTDAAGATRLALALLAAPLEPVAMDWAADRAADGDGALLVRFQGREDAVERQVVAASALAVQCLGAGAGGTRGAGVAAAQGERLEGGIEAAAWDALAERGGDVVVRGVTLPSLLGDAAQALAGAARTAGVTATLRSHAGLGLHDAFLSGGSPEGLASTVDAWRRALVAYGGSAVVRHRCAGLEGVLDVWGPPPPALDLMRAVKQQLDPERRCAPGRFVGGL